MEDVFKESKKSHKIWYKFEKFLISNFGEDYHDNLAGYECQEKVRKFIENKCPEIKIVRCDDEVYSSSFLILVPHPSHGITILFIPQCTTIGNHFFLYEGHCEMLMEELEKMKKVYSVRRK